VDNSCDGLVDPDPICAPCTSWPSDGKNYLLCNQLETWTTARDICRGLGYDLITFNDQAEESAVSGEWNLQIGGSGWSGYNDRVVEGVWVWSSGETSPFTDWAAGEPNNAGNEDCSQFNWSGLAWNDAQCANSQPFACEN
jgi:hypothetical protein